MSVFGRAKTVLTSAVTASNNFPKSIVVIRFSADVGVFGVISAVAVEAAGVGLPVISMSGLKKGWPQRCSGETQVLTGDDSIVGSQTAISV